MMRVAYVEKNIMSLGHWSLAVPKLFALKLQAH